MNRHQLEPRHGLRIAAALAIALLLVHGAAWAGPAKSCGTSITACGCTITTSGLHTVTTNLSYTQGLTVTGDCIDIAANNVSLNLNGNGIEGPYSPTGAGIKVLALSSGAFIEGGDGYVYGWEYGLQVQGKNAASDYLYPVDNWVGVFLDGASGANINDFETYYNEEYGIWIRGGQGNQVSYFYDHETEYTGIYIGCSDNDTPGTICTGMGLLSTGNRIYNCTVEDNGDAGLVIDIGNGGNVITDCDVEDNEGGTDSIDENQNCGSDLWFYGYFGATNQSCIP